MRWTDWIPHPPHCVCVCCTHAVMQSLRTARLRREQLHLLRRAIFFSSESRCTSGARLFNKLLDGRYVCVGACDSSTTSLLPSVASFVTSHICFFFSLSLCSHAWAYRSVSVPLCCSSFGLDERAQVLPWLVAAAELASATRGVFGFVSLV